MGGKPRRAEGPGSAGGSAELPAKTGVGAAEAEERDGQRDEDEIVVHDDPSMAPAGRGA